MNVAAGIPTPPTSIMVMSARLHLETAIGLVGKEQIQTWLAASDNTFTLNAKTTLKTISTTSSTGQRGRKAGIIPTNEERCVWKLTSGDQCSNKRKDGSTLCGLHVNKAHLLSSSISASSIASVSNVATDSHATDVSVATDGDGDV